MQKIIAVLLLYGSSALLFADPVELTGQFVSVLTARKYYKYDAVSKQYVVAKNQVTVDGVTKEVDYFASYANNDKYWCGNYSSFGTGCFAINGINFDFYTEESYYILRIVADDPISDDAAYASYALDLDYAELFYSNASGPTLQLVQLPWTFSDLAEYRDVYEYNPSQIFEEITKGPVVGEFTLSPNKTTVSRVWLKGLKANEKIYSDGIANQYEYGIFTFKVKQPIDFTKCGGVKEYRLSSDIALAGSLTDANGYQVAGLDRGLQVTVCVNGYTTSGYGFTVNGISIRHRAAIDEALLPNDGSVSCKVDCANSYRYHCAVGEVFELYKTLNLTQTGLAGENVVFEGILCNGQNPLILVNLVDNVQRTLVRSQGITGYKISWGGSKESYGNSSVSHVFTQAGTYTVIVWGTFKIQQVDVMGRVIGYQYPDYELLRRTLVVQKVCTAKTASIMEGGYGFDRQLTPIRAYISDKTIAAGQKVSYNALESIIVGPAFNVQSYAEASFTSPIVILLPGFNVESGSSVYVEASKPVLLKQSAQQDGIPVVDRDSTQTAGEKELRFMLVQNQPNPFNPNTIIEFILPGIKGMGIHFIAKLQIFDAKGRLIRKLVDAEKAPGRHYAEWDGKDLSGKQVSAGVYIYRLTAGRFTEYKRMILAK